MTIKSTPYFWLECDAPGCRVKSTDDNHYSAWSDPGGAEEMADEGWRRTDSVKITGGKPTYIGARHYCAKHAGRVCDECEAYGLELDEDQLCGMCRTSAA